VKPTKPITDPSFAYVSSTNTDLRERFKELGWIPPSKKRPAPVIPISRKAPRQAK